MKKITSIEILPICQIISTHKHEYHLVIDRERPHPEIQQAPGEEPAVNEKIEVYGEVPNLTKLIQRQIRTYYHSDV
jgi:hypothetical protein